MKTPDWVFEDMDVSKEDVDEYILDYRFFTYPGVHEDIRVVLFVFKEELDVAFTIDGVLERDSFVVNPKNGALILRRLYKEWVDLKESLKKKLPAKTEICCYSVDTDDIVVRRVEILKKAGFGKPDDTGKMTMTI